MSKTSRRIKELFEQIDVTPWGPQERAMVNEAIDLAVEAGDDKLEYQARMRLTASANMSGDTDTLLSSFAWCLAKHDSNPRRYPADLDNGGADLLWQFKWMAGTLGASPIFPKEDIAAVLSDMEQHYDRAGLGRSGVLTSRFEDAWTNGRIEEASALRAQLEATPRDSHSHCDACGRSQMAGFFAETGREDDAIRLVEEMIEGGFSCGDEPEAALGRALVPYLRAGRLDDAKNAHMRSYRLSRDNADKIGIVAANIQFCAMTGNEARGLAMIERHIGWLAHDGLNQAGHFSVLVAMAVTLDAVIRAGHGDQRVRGAEAPALVPFFGEHGFGEHEGVWTVAELAPAMWAAAARIGERFDERNGNGYFAERIANAKALENERYDVPLSSDTFMPVVAPQAAPTDAAGWLALAKSCADTGKLDEGLAAAGRSLDAGISGVDRDVAFSLLLGALVRQEKYDEAAAVLPDRIASLRANDRETQAALEERQGLRMFGYEGDGDVVERLEQELVELTAAGAPSDVIADVQLTLAFALYGQEDQVEHVRDLARGAVEGFEARPQGLPSALSFHAHVEAMVGDRDVALAALDRLLALEPGDGATARALGLRARLHGGGGDFESGARDADAALALLTKLDVPQGMLDMSALAGNLLLDLGDPHGAVQRLRFAARQAEILDTPAHGIQFAYGRALLHAGEPSEALEILQVLYQKETEEEAAASARADTLAWIAQAAEADEQFGNAVGAWDYAADLYAEDENSTGVARARTAHGRLLARFGEHEDAVASLTDALAEARKTPEELGLISEAQHWLGRAKASHGDAGGLDDLDAVYALAVENEATWLAADVTDSRARALAELGRKDEAVQTALVAADRYAATGDLGSAGGSELLAGRVLTETGRGDDAVAVFRSALERAAEIPPLRTIVALELGDVLESLGRAGEAAEVRALAE